jgi:hypothetical protein
MESQLFLQQRSFAGIGQVTKIVLGHLACRCPPGRRARIPTVPWTLRTKS